MADESGAVDYLEHSLRSIYKVTSLLSGGTLEINGNLCGNVIGHELQALENFLMMNWDKLLVKDLVNDRRRVALLHLYPVVKQAENLVQQCCESTDSTWPERALSLRAMKEDVLDILLHLRWWTTILDIVIDSAMSLLPNSLTAQHIEAKRLERAGCEFEETLTLMALFDVIDSTRFDETERKALVKSKMDTFKKIQEQNGLAYADELGTKEHLEFILSWNPREAESGIRSTSHAVKGERRENLQLFKNVLIRCIKLHNAALEDKKHLLSKAFDVMGSSFTGELGSREHHAYLLAKQVYSLLTDEEIDGIPELNECPCKCTIGKGTFGVVTRVTWCGLDCVLKQTFHDLDSPERSEAKSLKRFSHPHIVKFYRHFVASPDENHRAPLSHIVMERMPLDLKQHMDNIKGRSSSSSKRAPFSEPVAVDIMLQLAKAMWHMHSRSVVHRDLKPGNVLVRPVSGKEQPELSAQGYVQVKLGDFGLVRENILSSHPHLLMSHRAGTMIYRAPELSVPNPTVTKAKGVDRRVVPMRHPHKADLWSFGVMSSEILTGDVPFSEDLHKGATLMEIIRTNVRPRLPNDCPDYLRLCIESCWKFNPLERPRFADVWRMLRLAKLRSVGLILDNNLDWFMDKNRLSSSVVGISPGPTVVSNGLAEVNSETTADAKGHARPSKRDKKEKWNFSFLMSAFFKFKGFKSPKLTHDQGLGIHYRSPHRHVFTYHVNKVWPRDKDADWKLDVIFFEGNVGGRHRFSCRDTWLQRDQPNVFWPQDWLPQDVHNKRIRVLVVQYVISETGLDGLVNDIKDFLVFSDQWSQNRTWKSPIVLVGHSLGCTVIEALVTNLEQSERQSYRDSSGATSSTYDKTKMDTSRAFMCSVRGCFFYAYPSYGLVRSESLLKEVFGGLIYSEDLFAAEFQEGSQKMLDRSAQFLKLAKERSPQIRLMSLVEGGHTRGRFVVRGRHRQPDYDLSIENTMVLGDSNHIQISKPVDREHPSYVELVKFLIINSLSNLNSYHESRSCKSNESDKESNNDESYIIVDELDTSLSVDPQSSRELESPSIVLKEEPDTSFSIDPQSSKKPEGPNMILKENEERVDMVKQKLNEIDNVVEMQQVDAMGLNSDESEVLIICNLNDKDDTLVFHLPDGQSMARVVGVGLDYAKVILRNGVDIEVIEIVRPEWESAWSHAKALVNTLYKTMKVKVPMQNDEEDDVDIVMARPLLWDVAKYFMLEKFLVALSNSDAGGGEQSSKNDQGQGNGSGSSNDSKSTIASLDHAIQSWPSMGLIKRDDRNDDGDENGDASHIGTKNVDSNGSHAKVKVDLLAKGYSFKKFYSEDYGVQIANKSNDLEIKCYLDFDFVRNEEGKKISLTMAHIRFGIYEDPNTGDEELEGDRYGAYHDELKVLFSVDKPESIGISKDVDVHDYKLERISHTEGSSNSKGKQKEVGATLSIGGGIVGASMNGGVGAKLTHTIVHAHTTILLL